MMLGWLVHLSKPQKHKFPFFSETETFFYSYESELIKPCITSSNVNILSWVFWNNQKKTPIFRTHVQCVVHGIIQWTSVYSLRCISIGASTARVKQNIYENQIPFSTYHFIIATWNISVYGETIFGRRRLSSASSHLPSSPCDKCSCEVKLNIVVGVP